MMDAPSFVLSGSDGTLVAQGVDAAYPDIAGARAALRSGRTPILVGALPFDVGGPAALMAPRTHQFTDTLPSWPAQPASNVRIAATVPTAEQHGVRIGRALAALRDPDNPLRKVVLARALQVSAERPWDVRTVLRHLATADPQAYTYLADLTPAGPDHAGRTLIGASPVTATM
jgi:isochorismate synthase